MSDTEEEPFISEEIKEKKLSTIGVDPDIISTAFKCHSADIPAIYLLYIGSAKDIFDDEKYSDDDYLCKFGCTDNMVRRCGEHRRIYKKVFKRRIEILYYSIIDVQNIHKAEIYIKKLLGDHTIEYNDMKELIIINKKELSNVQEIYKLVQMSYIGRYAEMQEKIHNLEVQLEREKHIYELLNEQHKNEIKDKELMIQQEEYKNKLKEKEIELIKKEFELMKLQN